MPTSRHRIKLFRLAFDAAVSSFSGRQQLYERYYSGDPVRLSTLYEIYDKDPHVDRITQLLDDLETQLEPAMAHSASADSLRSRIIQHAASGGDDGSGYQRHHWRDRIEVATDLRGR